MVQFDDTDEGVEIENFLAIQKCKVGIKELTVFIGPQASGKSIIAKVAYFGRAYLREAVTVYAASQEDKRSFHRRKSDEFYELFPGADSAEHKFSVLYTLGADEIRISKRTGNRSLAFKMNANLDRKVQKVRKDYFAFLEENKDESQRIGEYDWYLFQRANPKYRLQMFETPRVLHIPATRAFFSAVKKNFFSFLSESKTIDPLMVQFGRFLELAKTQYTGDGLTAGTRDRAVRNKDLEAVIGGQYTREKEEDIIVTKWGKVSLQSSSSGQQEVLPLLLALLQYPNRRWKNDLIIIEEPEAHLFPRAQKAVIEKIVEVIVTTNCKVVITTHSPYIIACLNNHLQIKKPAGRSRGIDAACYFIDAGRAEDLFDYEDRLIDVSRLDEVSGEIAEEFVRALSSEAKD